MMENKSPFQMPVFTPSLRRRHHSLHLFYRVLSIVPSGFAGTAGLVFLTDITLARPIQHSLSNRMNLQGVNMDDLLYLGLTVSFFALSVALVYALEKLRRPQ
jgi:hypothetical protein